MRLYIRMTKSRHSLRSFGLLFVLIFSTLYAAAAQPQGSYLFYVGTYTNDDGKATNSKGKTKRISRSSVKAPTR